MTNPPAQPRPWQERNNIVWLAVAATVLAVLATLYLVRGDVPQPVNADLPAAGDLPRISFVDITREAGIDFVHRSGATSEKLLPETGGGGVAFFDYDNDGAPDLLLVNGREWTWSDAADEQPANALTLYRNDGGKFVDVTDSVGLRGDYLGQGVAIGDFDGDGDEDVFVTALGGNHLYRNDGGRFVEVTAEAGVAGSADDWTTSAGFFDYDRDGDLDLFVCNYVRWTREIDLAATRRVSSKFHSYAHPENFAGMQNYLFRNDGGRFTDVSEEAGIHVVDAANNEPLGKALAVTFVDFDGDGWIDVFVANDTVRHFLFRNRGDGTFEEVGLARGFAVNAAGATTSGMGIDAAWLRNDDALAVAVGNFANELTEVFVAPRTDEAASFSDEALTTGMGEPTRDKLTFGLLMDDFDLDGRVDLVQANGHLEPDIHRDDPQQRVAQPAQLFWNTGGDERPLFAELPAASVGDLARPIVGRAIASADIDGDGDLDLVITQVGGPPLVVRNDRANDAHWLRCRLEGRPGNPHAIGAVVEVQAGDTVQRRTLMPTRGYLSQSEPVVTFGLGDHASIDSLSVRWPDGVTEEYPPPEVDQLATIRQSAAAESFATLANKGKAELENGEYEAAIALFEAALRQQPDSLPIRRNLARAFVLGGRADEASELLRRLAAEVPRPSAANAYLAGLAALRQLNYELAVEHFTQAVELDPAEATLRFQLALALTSLGRTDDARQEFERATQIDPLHGGAQYQLAVIARKAGEQDAFASYMRDYQRIRALKGTVDPAALEECRYTRPEALEFEPTAEARSDPAAAVFVLVPLGDEQSEDIGSLVDVAVLGMANEGRYQLVGVRSDGHLLAFEFDATGQARTTVRSEFSLGEIAEKAVVLVGHAVDDQTLGVTSDNQAGDWPEIAVVTPERSWLLHFRPDTGFVDLTQRAGLAAAAGSRARWIDLDHDGDIDLCLLTESGVVVWRNNSDGTFVDATEEFGLTDFATGNDLAAADFDGTNLGIDLVVAGDAGAALARNQFAGRLASEPATAAAWPATLRVLADDFVNNGLPDLVFLSPSEATLVVTGSDERHEVALGLDRLDAATTIDVDNDGWLDVAVVGAAGDQQRTVLVRNAGGRFSATPQSLPTVGAAGVRRLLDLDADGDGDTDLVVIDGDGRLVVLRNDTPTENQQLKLVLRSFSGHPSSIGTRVEVRRQEHAVTRWTSRELPIELGMGPHTEADSIQTLWPNGVAKNDIGVALTGQPIRISILEFVRTSSCPFLYAWIDGQWQFVTDLLGNAPLNVAVARGVPMPPDPDEVVVLGPAERFAEGDLAARLRITSELREVIYLNHVELLAVDHPADTTVFSRDRATLSPSEGPQLTAGRAPRVPREATGSDGIDRTAALGAIDEDIAPPGRLLPPPLVGFTEPLSIELDFGPLDDDANYLLTLTGWFRFGNSSTNIAASQRGDIEVIWPRLEVAMADGSWQVIDEHVGFPAGNTKTIVCDLAGKLPPEARRFRLTTSFEVRWDQVALYESVPASELMVRSIAPASADLGWHGFAELRAARPDLPQVPNLARLSDIPPWQTALPGWCTRYGEVSPLLLAADDTMAILSSGDGVTCEFAADGMPQPARGKVRSLAIYTRGWIKEDDPNSLADHVIAPLPDRELSATSDVGDWQLELNTRWVPRDRFRPGASRDIPVR